MNRAEAIAIWKKAPEATWLSRGYKNHETGQCCALGHIDAFDNEYFNSNYRGGVALVNDGEKKGFEFVCEHIKRPDLVDNPKALAEWKAASPKRRVLDACAKGYL